MRQCPTVEGQSRPLITHQIASSQCLARQRDFYHKCHRCVYRGKPADYVHSEPEPVDVAEVAAAGRNGFEGQLEPPPAAVEAELLVRAET